MHSVGPDPTTANAECTTTDSVKTAELNSHHIEDQQSTEPIEGVPIHTTNASNVIPTSPQYGVAIIATTTSIDVGVETTTSATDTLTETTAKTTDGDNKDMHSTPSRNDRFKVVKIASLEPFRRGRWKCMDYVDQTPTPTTVPSKASQSTGNLQLTSGVFMQTQSLPQQNFQQMLIGGVTNPSQYYQSQLIPQTQYYYPPNVNIPQQQIINSSGVPQANLQPQFINTSLPSYYISNSGCFTVPNFPNVQYVPSNVVQNQTSAFVPTSQNVNTIPANFQQSQTYAGPPTVSQSNVQPIVNGHAFPAPNDSQVVASSLPTQNVKNVILNATVPQNISQSNISQPQSHLAQTVAIQSNTAGQTQTVPVAVIQNQQQYTQSIQNAPYQNITTINPIPQQQQQIPQPTQPQSMTQIPQVHQQQNVQVPQTQVQQTTIPSNITQVTQIHQIPQVAQIPPNVIQVPQVNYDPNLPTNVYTNPQFVASVNSIPNMDQAESQVGSEMNADGSSIADVNTENQTGDDSTKPNPIANAIDNKIEQAMDLVKSHLMYTVREEVEILKEKIAELMERIQQLETENNQLRQQISKNQGTSSSGTPDPPQ